MFTAFDFAFVRCAVQPLRSAYHFDVPSPLVAEGIYLSSSSLWERWEKKEALAPAEKERVRQVIRKYQVRSATRCTPFGTFAGIFKASLTAAATSLLLEDPSSHKKIIHIDRGCLATLIERIGKIESIREQLLFFISTSNYETPQAFRYARYHQLHQRRRYELTAVHRNEWIDQLYQLAKNGVTLQQVRELLQKQFHFEITEIDVFIHEMIDAQWLVSELEMNLTGTGPFERLIMWLQQLQGDVALTLHQQLVHLRSMMSQHVVGPAYLRTIGSYIESVLEINSADKLQVNLHLATQSATINRNTIDKVLQQLEQLTVLRRSAQPGTLDQFRQRFLTRYDQQWVPLGIALDEDAGIGYGNVSSNVGDHSLIDDLLTTNKPARHSATDAITNFTSRKYLDWIRSGAEQLTITPADLDELAADSALAPAIFPRSMYVMGLLHQAPGQTGDAPFLFEQKGMGGPSAANLLSRFAIDDPALQDSLASIIREDECNPDCLYAEIVHLPEGRTGNVLGRPLLREFEITYAGISGASKDQQLSFDDLYVSVRKGEVIVVSRKHNKRVLPRLTSAHNFTSNSLPVYRFLCDLQTQLTSLPVGWDWGVLDTEMYLPRVCYQNILVRRAEWKITKKEFNAARKNGGDEINGIRAWRLERHLPEKIVIVEGDHELCIDLERAEGIALLAGFFERREQVRVLEFTLAETASPVQNENGESFAHELIVPFTVTTNFKKEDAYSLPVLKGKEMARHLFPGSAWVYFKIYAGEKSIEHVLATTLHAFVQAEMGASFDRFFFVRYRDEFPHLRIRFHTPDPLLLQKRLLTKLDPLCQRGEIWRITTDTYDRELERYAPVMEESEALFTHDSLCQLRLVHLLNETDDDSYRLLLAIRGIDTLFNDFRISMTVRMELSRKMQLAFAKEFNATPGHFKLLNDKYRSWQKRIASHLDPLLDNVNDWTEAIGFLEQRSASNRPLVEQMDEQLHALAAPARRDELITSFIHMSVNRLFLSHQRKYEWLVYYFLERYYMSKQAQVARMKPVT